MRSNIATRLDSFTIDEPWHIAAGVAYVKTGDFRLNPEHPPLVKLWVGAFVSSQGFQLSPYRALHDKADERESVETDVYFNNDPDAVQSRSRTAMFALNGLLLFLLALALRRVFGDIIALTATAFLAIDPTVAAHLTVVMTDLPVALLSTTAVLLSVQAFRSWRAVDLILAAVALGLALSAKHSAVITMIVVAAIGFALAIFQADRARAFIRLRRVGAVAAVLIGSAIVLWSFYLFRFYESPTSNEEQFNRPLAMKISDVNSSAYRAGLNLMAKGVFPRTYTWGMADTIRAGAEGRAGYKQAPFYYFPRMIAVKIPLGLLLLTIVGIGVSFFGKIPREWIVPLLGATGLAILFLLALVRGSNYGGIRHALPVFPALALFGALAVYQAVKYKSYLLRGSVVISILGALLSAIPVLRPWEYFNEIVGGNKHAYRYFGGEGLDLGLRLKELVEYYNQNLKPVNEVPIVFYESSSKERRRRGLDWVGKNPERDRGKLDGEIISGTIIIGAKAISPKPWWDRKEFREAVPIARMGNLFVFRGEFRSPGMRAFNLYYDAVDKIYTAEPETEEAIKLLSESVALDAKAFFVALELGNQYLKVGNREEALRAYRIAKENAPPTDDISEQLARQIERIEKEPLEQISLLRNPEVE